MTPALPLRFLRNLSPHRLLCCAPLRAALLSVAASAQGALTLTPGSTIATVAGTGTAGYSGSATTGVNATLGNPTGLAYDGAGNLYFADTQNHVIRRLTPAGAISTVAGNGTEGFAGDGAAATAAQLDTPIGVALDAAGNLYIADSFNNRIRMVTATSGTISTIAGTGAAGYTGDSGAATTATLAHPAGLAFDSTGNLYIADAQNHVIRKITGTTITTVAGNGTEGFGGDGSTATSAQLDTPVGLAFDTAGNLYIADRNNQVVRLVAGTTISTFAGNNAYSFAGDGGTPTAGSLARPSGVAIDNQGNLLIADRDNDRIREVSGGALFTAVGNGVPQFAGDGGTPTAASLQQPRGVAAAIPGTFAVADSFNQRLRSITPASLSFGSVASGSTSAPQTVTLSNTGNASLTVATVTFNGPFSNSGAGTCGSPPITLAAGASCSVTLVYQPVSSTGVAGSAVFMAGGGGAPQLLLTGDEGTATTTLKLAVNPGASTYGQPVTLSATLSATPSAGESVAFTSNGQTLFTVPLNGNTASISTSALRAGNDTIVATYSGDTMLSASTSNAVTVAVAQSTPVLRWVPSTNQLPSGIAIPASVLDATANASGTFAYSTTVNGNSTVLTAGVTTLPAGSYTFVVNFTPSDTADETSSSATIVFTITTESIWIANNNQTFSIFSQAGAPVTGSSGSGKANFASPIPPRALAFDGSGDAYVLSQSALYLYPPSLSNLSPTPATGGGLSQANAVVIDGAGDAWVANRGGTLSVFTSAGTAVTPSTGYPGVAGGVQAQYLAIDSSGNVWVTTRVNANVLLEQFLGAAAPVAPTATAIANGKTGARP